MLKQYSGNSFGINVPSEPSHYETGKMEEMAYRLDLPALLKLLYIYQGIIASRPIELGNQEFLECMISASRKIAHSLTRLLPQKRGWVENLPLLCNLIEDQTVTNAKTLSTEVLKHIAGFFRKQPVKKSSQKLFVQTTLLALTGNYQNIHVIFGPGLGLGDQITFYPFLKSLTLQFPECPFTIYTLYPSLWRNLLPKAKEIHYRDRPLRPFYQMSHIDRAESGYGRELVIVADFDSFGFYRDIIPSKGRDVIEIGLGKGSAWQNCFDSPWIKFETFSSRKLVGNNYWILSELADRLLPNQRPHPGWLPVRTKPNQARPNEIKRIFLNPFTSKKYGLQPEDWHRFLALLKTQLGDVDNWEIIVFSGLNAQSKEFATQICHLCQNDLDKIPARMLLSKDRKLPTVFDTFTVFSTELPKIHLVITVDTFTGHFMPLYGIPTLVLTDRDNKAFWVPCPWSYYCLLNNLQTGLPTLAASILTLHKEKSLFLPETKKLISKITAITQINICEDSNTIEIEALQTMLFKLLQLLPPNFPYKSQGQKWLFQWGQLTAAIKKDPITADALLPYVQNWLQSEFFKLISLTRSNN